MDRSYLSNPEVIAASRGFVCVRLSTYESAAEAKVLRSFFTGPTGALENTVFAIVAPDGRTPLVRSGRSPAWAFRTAAEMAAGMRALSAAYAGPLPGTEMPYVASVRLALNVAACDGAPLVVLYGRDSRALRALEEKVGPVAWDQALRGRLTYASTMRAADLGVAGAVPTASGILVIEPGPFGVDGRVVARLDAATSGAAMKTALLGVLASHRAVWKDTRSHIEQARRQGVRWETEIPVTDSHDPEPAGTRAR